MLPIPLRKIALYLGLMGLGTAAFLPLHAQAWNYVQQISLNGHACVGIAADSKGNLYLSATDANLLLRYNLERQQLHTVLQDLDRPMHLSSGLFEDDEPLYVAEYGSDRILILGSDSQDPVYMKFDLDAPAGVDAQGKKLAIADFYNHRIVISDNGKVSHLGQKGHKKGELEYPTDVQFVGDQLWVADAYNHRVQVWDLKKKKVVRIIGEKAGINAATGIFVNAAGNVFVTDFEHSRVLLFNGKGKLLAELIEGLDKPTDVIQVGKDLFIVNNHGKDVVWYRVGG